MTLKVAVAKVTAPVNPALVEPTIRSKLDAYDVLQRESLSLALQESVAAKRVLSNDRSITQLPSDTPALMEAFTAIVTVPPGRTDGDDASARMMT